jgi:glycosyltransferase involved in cell wall biosynthesis
MPLISVIIPCYNAHEYLEDAISSVQQQDFHDYEIIVVNDGSTAKATIESLAKLPAVIQVIHQENRGLAGARNTGIAAAKGSIIITLDSDDRFHRSFFSKAAKKLAEDKFLGIVTSYVQEFGESHKVWRSTAVDDFSFLTENRIVACCAFRRICWEDAGGYDETMRSGMEDWDFWIRVTQRGWKVCVLAERLFYYRKKKESMLVSETRPRMEELVNYIMQKHQDWFLSSIRKGIVEKQLLNKKNLSLRRIAGLFYEKLTGKF